MEGVQICRMVHFVDNQEHLAAVIIKVLDGFNGIVNLHVFASSLNSEKQTWIMESVKYSPSALPRTWHWPERT